MCDITHPDYINCNDYAIKDHIDEVIDFYHRFVIRMRKKLNDNPQTDLISIMGP